MLTRIHVKGYKSLRDVEVRLPSLALLLGPNAAGKSNFLDALQLLSRLATRTTLKEAFEAPHRGEAIESFSMGAEAIPGLRARDRVEFTIEADLRLPDAVAQSTEREIRHMRHGDEKEAENGRPRIRERNLRYRVTVEMLPDSAVLRVADEYLAALNTKGQPTGSRKPFLERQNERIHLRLEGQAHPTYFDRYLDRTILSMPHYPPHHPHLTAVRRELENWQFFYFEPREHMRALTPIREVRYIGPMGQNLAAFLRTLKTLEPSQFRGMERALKLLLPQIDGIDLDVSDLGEVELRLRENGIAIPARVLSEGTLRILGLLALGAASPRSLVGFEEPENGVHPDRVRMIADFLKTQRTIGETQYLLTTHSPLLPELMPDDCLFTVSRKGSETRIERQSRLGIWKQERVAEALTDAWQAP